MKTLATLGFAVVALTFVAATPMSAVAAPPAFVAHDHDVHVDYSTRGSKSRHLHDHHEAHDLANFLRSVGARVRIEHDHGSYDVVYTCSPQMKWFHEDRDAHRFARDLRRYGFTARVHH